MCKYAYIQLNRKTKQNMIYCSGGVKINSEGLCICQRYCKDKSCYIPHNQDKMHCKYYEDC